MKIWVASELDLSQPGGPLEHLAGRWNAIQRRGHEVTLFVPSPTGTPARRIDFAVEAISAGDRARQFVFQGNLFSVWNARIRAGERPDCIYIRAGQWLLAPALIARRKKIPYFAEVNGVVLWSLTNRGLPQPALRFAEMVEYQLCRNARCIFAISPSIGEALIRQHGISEERVECSPAGVDCSEFRPSSDAAERQAARQRFGCGEGIHIGYVGTFDWWQGLPNLLRAVAAMQAAKRGGNWKVHLAGFGAGEAELRKLSQTLNLDSRVEFMGKLNPADVPAFLRALDIGVLPRGDYAPSPTKLLQYFAAGLPSVYPAIGDLIWLGEAGETYAAGRPPEAEDGLCGALIRVCEDAALREKLSARSRVLAVRSLDWNILAEKMEARIRRVL